MLKSQKNMEFYMKYEEALKLALESVDVIKETKLINIEDSLNRVLSKDIYALRDFPIYNNSAMDGYGFKYKDINNYLTPICTILAGDIQKAILKDNECYKIMTGAKVPKDCDTVAPKEICTIKDNKIQITKPIKKGNAIRLKGEEIKKGSLLLKKGERLNASKIALLASQGINKIECYKELKIAIISTGSELKEVGEEATKNEIYNINGINIKMHLKEYGINANYLGVLPDNLEKAVDFFKNITNYNIIITTGGVSVGDADFTKEALIKNGFKELFHGIKVKPGHPTLMGKINKTFIMAMPGNPLAAITHIILMGLPLILKMQGAKRLFFRTKEAKITTTLTLKPNRVNIVLGRFKSGKFKPYKKNSYGSGMILPLVKSNAFVLFSEEIESVKKGSTIKVVEFLCQPMSKKFDYKCNNLTR